MDEAKLKDFLKDYVEILKAGVDISIDLPLSYKVEMAGRCIKILTHDGLDRIFISFDEGGGGCMPIGPGAITYAKLIVTLLNKYYEVKINDSTN